MPAKPAAEPDVLPWRGVAREEVAEWWPRVEFLLTRALKRGGESTPAALKASLEAGKDQLWIVLDGDAVVAVTVTTIALRPAARVCRVLICTGSERFRWQGHLSIIERWAAEQGCSRMKLPARPGWKPFLEARGYRQTHVLMERELK